MCVPGRSVDLAESFLSKQCCGPDLLRAGGRLKGEGIGREAGRGSPIDAPAQGNRISHENHGAAGRSIEPADCERPGAVGIAGLRHGCGGKRNMAEKSSLAGVEIVVAEPILFALFLRRHQQHCSLAILDFPRL